MSCRSRVWFKVFKLTTFSNQYTVYLSLMKHLLAGYVHWEGDTCKYVLEISHFSLFWKHYLNTNESCSITARDTEVCKFSYKSQLSEQQQNVMNNDLANYALDKWALINVKNIKNYLINAEFSYILSSNNIISIILLVVEWKILP